MQCLNKQLKLCTTKKNIVASAISENFDLIKYKEARMFLEEIGENFFGYGDKDALLDSLSELASVFDSWLGDKRKYNIRSKKDYY